MMDSTIPANDIVGADLGAGNREGVQSFRAAVLSRMVDNDEIRFAQVEIDRADPIGRSGYRVSAGSEGRLADDTGVIPRLLLIDLVGCSVWVGRACGQQEEKEK